MALELIEDERDLRPNYIEGLRALADALDANPDLPLPDSTSIYHFPMGANPDEIRQELGRIARALPGRVDKQQNDGAYSLLGKFGPITYEVYSSNVCERRKVGTRTVEREVAVETRTEAVNEDVFEYDCPPLLPDAA